MLKKIIIIIFILFSINNFGFEEIDLDKLLLNAFGSELKIGLSSLGGKSIFLKITEGKIKIISGENKEILEKNDEIKLEESNGKILYKGNTYDKIEFKKLDIVTITSVGKTDKNYRNYRGNFEFIIEKGKIIPINIITAEEYLYSVVPSEIGIKFPEEAIKAQAVAARSYLYYGLQMKKYEKYELMDDTSSQMYLGYDKEVPHINKLVNETEGEVAVYEDEYINALYHSASGGITANNEDVWGGTPVPYLRTIDDKDNWKKSPRAEWSYKISKNAFSKIMGYKVNNIRISSSKNKRVSQVRISGEKTRYVSGNNLRKLLGYTNIFSTVFRIKESGAYFIFEGNGSGHGVGLSQWGAYGLAEKGYDYRYILKYYYSGIEIKNIENLRKYDIIESKSNY